MSAEGYSVRFRFAPGDKVDAPSLGLSAAIVEICAEVMGGRNKYSVIWMGNGSVSREWLSEDLLEEHKE